MSKILTLIGQRFIAVNKLPVRSSLIFHIESNNYSCLTAQSPRPCEALRAKQPAIPAHLHRLLFTEESLRIDSLDSHQQNIAKYYRGHEREAYLSRIKRYLEAGDSSAILLQDLINVIGLAYDENDLDLVESLVSNIKEADQLSIQTWGSAVMRLYYKMNQVDRAYKNIHDTKKFGNFFDAYNSYRIAMVALYDNERYDEVLDLYNLSLVRLDGISDIISDRRFLALATIALGTLAKQNKPNSYEVAEKIYERLDLSDCQRYQKTRIIAFLAYIAYNNNHFSLALNIISNSKLQNYITLRELKTLSLIRMKRYEDVLFHLKSSIIGEKGDKERKTLIDVVELLRAKTTEIESQVLRDELTEILDQIEKKDLVQKDTLDSLMFSKIDTSRKFRNNSSNIDNDSQDIENQGRYTNRRFKQPNRRYRENSKEPFADSV